MAIVLWPPLRIMKVLSSRLDAPMRPIRELSTDFYPISVLSPKSSWLGFDRLILGCTWHHLAVHVNHHLLVQSLPLPSLFLSLSHPFRISPLPLSLSWGRLIMFLCSLLSILCLLALTLPFWFPFLPDASLPRIFHNFPAHAQWAMSHSRTISTLASSYSSFFLALSFIISPGRILTKVLRIVNSIRALLSLCRNL